MKILCFIDSLGSGGAQRQLVELAKGFKDRGYEVSFLTYHVDNFFKPQLDLYNINVKTLVEPNYLRRLFKIRKAIRNYQPDAVISFLQSANFMATFAGFPYKKWKLIVGERSANPQILVNFKLKLYRKAHFFADFVVGNSYSNIEMVKQIIPRIDKSKLRVIYNIVNTPDKVEIDIRKNIKTNILVAASYRTVKNLTGLIEAINKLPNDYKSKLQINWYGSINNGKKYYQENLEQIKKYKIENILILNNSTDEIFEKYKQADFVGLFSFYEGFPNAICEAMAMGKPVIVSKVSDVPIFIKEKENGFLCDSHNSLSIMTALMKAIDSSIDSRRKMALNNLEISKNNFNRESIIKQYLNLLV